MMHINLQGRKDAVSQEAKYVVLGLSQSQRMHELHPSESSCLQAERCTLGLMTGAGKNTTPERNHYEVCEFSYIIQYKIVQIINKCYFWYFENMAV